MKTPITYYGGKQQLVDKIVAMIPQHKVYIEPFFGGGAVFFAKEPSFLEIINDINDNVVTFYRVLQNEDLFKQLQAMIQSTLFAEAVFLQAKTIWNGYWPASDVERAWAVWVVCNYSFNATPHGGWKWDNGTGGSHSGIIAAHKRNAFTEELFTRIQYAQISCMDAVSVLQERNQKDCFAYIDPPYIGCSQKHYHGYKEADFRRLLNELERFDGKFLLSTYANDIILENIERNHWNVYAKTRYSSITNLQNTVKKKTELLVYNYNNQTLF